MLIATSPGRTPDVVAVYPVTLRPLPLPMTGRQRLVAIRRWTGGFAGVILVGLAIPASVLLIGLPIALVVRLVASLVGRL